MRLELWCANLHPGVWHLLQFASHVCTHHLSLLQYRTYLCFNTELSTLIHSRPLPTTPSPSRTRSYGYNFCSFWKLRSFYVKYIFRTKIVWFGVSYRERQSQTVRLYSIIHSRCQSAFESFLIMVFVLKQTFHFRVYYDIDTQVYQFATYFFSIEASHIIHFVFPVVLTSFSSSPVNFQHQWRLDKFHLCVSTSSLNHLYV